MPNVNAEPCVERELSPCSVASLFLQAQRDYIALPLEESRQSPWKLAPKPIDAGQFRYQRGFGAYRPESLDEVGNASLQFDAKKQAESIWPFALEPFPQTVAYFQGKEFPFLLLYESLLPRHNDRSGSTKARAFLVRENMPVEVGSLSHEREKEMEIWINQDPAIELYRIGFGGSGRYPLVKLPWNPELRPKFA
jgi:hypothetical protein